MKPKSTRGQKTREKILNTASELIRRHGVRGTSVGDVLKASGTGKSQFYHYFQSKEGLVVEVIETYLADLPSRPDQAQALNSLEGIESWLDRIFSAAQSGPYRDGCPIGNIAGELGTDHETVRQCLAEIFDGWKRELKDGLAAAKRQGQLPEDSDPEGLALFIVASLEGALLLAKTHRTPRALKETLSQVKKHLRGTKGKSGPATGMPRPTPTPRPPTIGFCP